MKKAKILLSVGMTIVMLALSAAEFDGFYF